jgi:predicted butyrate kinase (DUF1464 family)
MQRAANADKETELNALYEFVKRPIRIPLAPIYQAQAMVSRRYQRLQKYALRKETPS